MVPISILFYIDMATNHTSFQVAICGCGFTRVTTPSCNWGSNGGYFGLFYCIPCFTGYRGVLRLVNTLSPVCIHNLRPVKIWISIGFQFVTCGSAIKLANVEYNIRLHSHDVKYGSGSGQQVGWWRCTQLCKISFFMCRVWQELSFWTMSTVTG